MEFETPIEFIKTMYPYAVELEHKTGIPHLFIIAQTANETAYGKSSLFTNGFNVGGIKAREGEPYILAWTWENTKNLNQYPQRDKTKDKDLGGGNWAVRIKSKFAKYPDLKTGLEKYAQIFSNANFKGYAAQAAGDPYKFVQLLQSGNNTGKKYSTSINYARNISNEIDTVKKVLA